MRVVSFVWNRGGVTIKGHITPKILTEQRDLKPLRVIQTVNKTINLPSSYTVMKFKINYFVSVFQRNKLYPVK